MTNTRKDKSEIINRLITEDFITDEEAEVLNESTDYEMMFSMYGEPEPREKNINRVIAGLKAAEFLPTVNAHVGAGSAVAGAAAIDPQAARKIHILELQMQKALADQRELHNRYVSLLRSQNQLINRNNELTRYVNEILEWSKRFRSE